MVTAALVARPDAVIEPLIVLMARLVRRLTLIPMPTPTSELVGLSFSPSVLPWICTVE